MFAYYYKAINLVARSDGPDNLEGVLSLESVLRVNIPVQMISRTDTDGKITPVRFRDRNGELTAVAADKVLYEDQDKNRVGAHFSCAATICGTRKSFTLWYNCFSHDWRLSRFNV